MRGTIFKDGIEYNTEIQGESWLQGAEIKGVVRIKGIAKTVPVKVALAYGKLKNIKSLQNDKWDIIEEKVLSTECLVSEEYEEFEWSFKLSEDAAITDRLGSLFILYGPDGNLQLNVEMKEIFQQYLEIFENFFRFKAGQIKYKKGDIEVKFKPPKSKEMASIDALTSIIGMKDDKLVIKYIFKVTALDSGAGIVQAKQRTQEIVTELNPKEYLIYGSSPNQESICKSIDGVLAQVKPKFMGQLGSS